MHEYYKIQDIIRSLLDKSGFTVLSENNEVDYYGSIRTEFINNDKRVLLEWNGKEGFGYAKTWENNGWQKLSTIVAELNEKELQQAIEKLCFELQGYVK